MTTRKKHKAKLLAVEAVAGDRDLIKALMKEALQEINSVLAAGRKRPKRNLQKERYTTRGCRPRRGRWPRESQKRTQS
jgi:hypothetical protein